MKKIITVMCLGLVSISAQASSEFNENWNKHQGAFVEGNVGTNVAHISLFGEKASGAGGLGLHANAGYQFNPYLGVEVGVGNARIDKANLPYGHVAARGTLPIGERVSVISKLGYGRDLTADDRDHFQAPFVGVGLQYAVSPNVELNAQVQGLVAGFANFGTIGAGLTYHV